MNWNIVLSVAIGALTVLGAGLAGHLASRELWHKWFFWGSGFVIVVLIYFQARLSREAPSAHEVADAVIASLDNRTPQKSTDPQVGEIADEVIKRMREEQAKGLDRNRVDKLKLDLHELAARIVNFGNQRQEALDAELRQLRFEPHSDISPKGIADRTGIFNDETRSSFSRDYGAEIISQITKAEQRLGLDMSTYPPKGINKIPELYGGIIFCDVERIGRPSDVMDCGNHLGALALRLR